MSCSAPPVLCINLAGARERWSHAEREVAAHLPDARLVRIDAVDWRSLSTVADTLPITLFSRYLLAFPQQQGVQRLSHRQLDTMSTVAISMSHLKCWEWLLNRPHLPCALILEDDACFDARFDNDWAHDVCPLLKATQHWDVLILGYFHASDDRTEVAIPETNVTTVTVSHFYGAHAYIVTQRGAEILRKRALPIDHQVDGLFLTLHQLGELRLRMLRHSAVTQCIGHLDREGSWHTGTVRPGPVQSVTCNCTTPRTLQGLTVALGLLAVTGWVLFFWLRRR